MTTTEKKIIGFQVLTLPERENCWPVVNKSNSQYYFNRKIEKQWNKNLLMAIYLKVAILKMQLDHNQRKN